MCAFNFFFNVAIRKLNIAHVLHILFLLDNANVRPPGPDHTILKNVPGAMWQTDSRGDPP